MQSFNEELVVTDGKQVICVSPRQDIHSLAVSLRNVACPPNIFALTGCDTVSGFVRDGKNQDCMSVQNLLLVLTDALLTLRSQNEACRPLRGCTHVYMSTCMHRCEQDWEEAFCPEQRIPLPYTALR